MLIFVVNERLLSELAIKNSICKGLKLDWIVLNWIGSKNYNFMFEYSNKTNNRETNY